jgi:hypothetical protein
VDTVNYTVNDPMADYIVIVDTPGTGSAEIPDQSIAVGFLITGYAASYNNTVGYLGDISVDWSVLNSGSDSDTSPVTGNASDFSAGLSPGTATWTADDGADHTETVIFTIPEPPPDYILIVNTPETGLTEIPDQAIDVGENVMGYAAAFNNTAGYIGDVSVTWSVLNVGTSASTSPSFATNSSFYSAS